VEISEVFAFLAAGYADMAADGKLTMKRARKA